MSRRVATIHAAALEVCCPACGGYQPNPSDGSHLWTAEQVFAEACRYTLEKKHPVCAECDSEFKLHPQQRALIGPVLK